MALKTVKLDAGAPSPDSTAGAKPETALAAQPEAAKTGFRKRYIFPAIGAVVGVGLLWLGGDWLLNGRFKIRTDNAFIRSDITRVTPKVQGYITAIHVEDNQPVKAGDLLVSLEASDFQTRVAAAKADLAQAQASAGIAGQRDALAEARAASEAAAASADWASSDAKRLAELAEKGWAAKATVEQRQAAERTAKAQRTQAEAAVTAQSSQLTS